MPQPEMRPFEGRAREIDHLLECWRLASDGAGQVAMVSAAAGVGKSRLIEELAERTAGDGRAFLVCRCSKRRRTTAFSPLADLRRRLLAERERGREERGSEERDSEGRDSETRRGETADPAAQARLRSTLVARLTALVAPAPRRRPAALNLNPEGLARKTLEDLLRLFSESAKRLPLLLCIEDLEWADPSTLELLKLLVHRRLHVPWMTVLTFTPGFEPPWSHRAHVTHLELPRLSHKLQEALLDRLLPGRALEPKLRQDVIACADGAPLLLEEQVRLIRDGDAAAVGGGGRPSDPPEILKHWLVARLKRLGAAGDLARSAAVVGEELCRSRLEAVTPLAGDKLEDAIERLIAAGILVRPGAADELAFRHTLIHEAIHDSLAETPYRRAHLRMAEVLSQAGDVSDPDYERVAYHFGEAGMPAEAASSWHQAAEYAVRSWSYLEAAERARRGLEALESVAGDERRRLEIDLQIVLGAALGTTEGFAAAGAMTAYDRALELASETAEGGDHFRALQELSSYYLSRGQVGIAHHTAERAISGLDPDRDDHAEKLPAARRTLGLAKLLYGDFGGASADLESSLAPFAVHRSMIQSMPPAIGIPMSETLSHLSLVEWFLGRPSHALKHSTDSLALARRCNDPYARVLSVFRASYLRVLRREPVATRELAHELVELANRHGFLFFIAVGMFLEGQALAAQGRAAEGLQMMSGGLDGVWASGMEVGRTRNLALLAEACGRSELFEQGLSLTREGIAAAEISGEGHFLSELYRVQGELLRHSGADEEEIEECFLEALGIARRQGTVALELRAAISLARLRRAQGKQRPALELLAEVHGKFHEGFDTADVKEAEELLDELA